MLLLASAVNLLKLWRRDLVSGISSSTYTTNLNGEEMWTEERKVLSTECLECLECLECTYPLVWFIYYDKENRGCVPFCKCKMCDRMNGSQMMEWSVGMDW